jgi:hypothetical protein
MQAPNPVSTKLAAWTRPGSRYAPYVLAALVLLVLLVWGEKFWLTNDDVDMSMVVGGYGIAALPSPDIVLETNVLWGWLLMHLPDVAGIRAYTLATYTLLLLSCLVIGVCLWRMRAPRLFAAAALLGMFAGVLLRPQFTLVAGYLAVAGFALVLASGAGDLRRSMAMAAPLLLLSGLIRSDELALVFLVACPFLVYAWRNKPDRWRMSWLALAGGCALLLGGASLYSMHYSDNVAWQDYNDIDSLRSQITDYRLGMYFLRHPGRLKGGGLSTNDVNMMRNFFLVDPRIFNSAHFAPLVASVTAKERIKMNHGRYDKFAKVFDDRWLLLMLSMFLVLSLIDRRVATPENAALLTLLALMAGISLWGRPGIVRIYTPAVAVSLVLALLKRADRQGGLMEVAGAVGVVFAFGICTHQFVHSFQDAVRATAARAGTCARLPKDQLLVVWTAGADFRWTDLYRPTTRDDEACDPALYAIDTYALSPPSLDRLHAYTGGKGFIEALTTGQSFYISTPPLYLGMLDRYLHEHYGMSLQQRKVEDAWAFSLFSIRAAPVGAGAR